MKCFLSILIFIHAFVVNADGLGEEAPSRYKITKTEAYKSSTPTLKINFVCPGDKCSKNGITMIVNRKDTIRPKLNSKNNFVYKTRPGKYKIYFASQGYVPLYTDSIDIKEGTITYMTVEFNIRRMHTRKPVIYLYPENITNVSLQLQYNGTLQFTYPQYDNGWNITAHPDGTIENGEKKYSYLFWDGEMDAAKFKIDYTKGQIVKKTDLVVFLEKTLSSIGLTSKETQDFITFWVPLMNKNEANFIHFLVNGEYDQVATLEVSPEPTTQLRVFMLWQNANVPGIDVIAPQQFKNFKREGFTLVEWGGAEINKSFD